MDRLTERNKHGVPVLRMDRISGSLQNNPVARLAEYEDTGMTPEKIAIVRSERDAAVRDLESLMMEGSPGDDACSLCKRSTICAEEVKDTGSCKCRPEWRGPREV